MKAHSKALRLAALLLGAALVLVGGLIAAAVLSLLPQQQFLAWPTRVQLALGGAVFIFAGLGILLFALEHGLAAARLGAGAMLCFVLSFNWIAFGPGDHAFRRSVSSSWSASESADISEYEGRAVFGGVALLLDALIVYALLRPKQGTTRDKR